MAIEIEQLIKIILGALVVVAVVVGVFLFFKFGVIDFFKNLMGGTEEEKIKEGVFQPSQPEQEIEAKVSEPEPLRLCEDCKGGLDLVCSEKECFEIDSELREFGKRCQFIPGGRFFKRIINPNQCITISA